METEEVKFDENKFKDGVFYLLNTWPVLRLAIENGWINDNNEKFRNSKEISENSKKKSWFQSEEEIAKNFTEELSQYILDYDVSQFDIEDYLLDKMDDMCVVVEDHSEKDLAKILLDFYEDLLKGSDKSFKEIVQLYEKTRQVKVEGVKEKKIQENLEEKSEKENEEKKLEEENDKIKNDQPLVDEDGFIMVTKKGKGKK